MDSFKSKDTLKIGPTTYTIYRLAALNKAGLCDLTRLPFSIRVLLENLLRNEDGYAVKEEDIQNLAKWNPKKKSCQEIAFTPARVILQDFTGVPAVVDLAAMRDAIRGMGGDAKKINPLQPVDLVIDHSVQVDQFGFAGAFKKNVEMEYHRNIERYQFLKWGQSAFRDFRVVPPGMGIVHQVNLEYLAHVVMKKESGDDCLAYPDTLVGTDSHTTMINGLGILGWGVGGIEAEAAMLGQPVSMLIPEVIGFKLTGKLAEGTTATDLVLTVTEMLRKKGVVGKFVEFFGPGVADLSLADRATLANMAPEYGATMGFFPVDEETLAYLKLTGREDEQIELVKTYLTEQGLFRTSGTKDPVFSDVLELNMSDVESSLAGPKRPQDRIVLRNMKASFEESLEDLLEGKTGSEKNTAKVRIGNEEFELTHGSVVISAITSCTNTSNPSVMIGAGLLAKNAVERGLKTKPWIKTSLAPGSKVVTDYLDKAGLMPFLEQLRFYLVGYGCTTCIGNSGPLPEAVANAIKEKGLVAASVLSGNRNFEGRIHPLVRANYLASPPLVVAYALAGSVDRDLTKDPLGTDKEGKPVYLKDIWPSKEDIVRAMHSIHSGMFQKEYSHVFEGDHDWKSMKSPEGDTFTWSKDSTYIKHPPYFENMPVMPQPLQDIDDARVLVMVGDSVTTDHISPAGAIPKDSPAAEYLKGCGVQEKDFNSFGARRGNHEVMIRGTFGNIRLRNLLAPGTEGGYTRHIPDLKQMTIFEAAMKYQVSGTPTFVIAGKEYGTGSSRDWAAKGPALLGVKVVIAESFERIHRSNLIGMGILPLQFNQGEGRVSFCLSGEESYSIEGIAEGLEPGKRLIVKVDRKFIPVICRIDTPVELEYYRHGGILQYVLRQLLKQTIGGGSKK